MSSKQVTLLIDFDPNLYRYQKGTEGRHFFIKMYSQNKEFDLKFDFLHIF